MNLLFFIVAQMAADSKMTYQTPSSKKDEGVLLFI